MSSFFSADCRCRLGFVRFVLHNERFYKQFNDHGSLLVLRSGFTIAARRCARVSVTPAQCAMGTTVSITSYTTPPCGVRAWVSQLVASDPHSVQAVRRHPAGTVSIVVRCNLLASRAGSRRRSAPTCRRGRQGQECAQQQEPQRRDARRALLRHASRTPG